MTAFPRHISSSTTACSSYKGLNSTAQPHSLPTVVVVVGGPGLALSLQPFPATAQPHSPPTTRGGVGGGGPGLALSREPPPAMYQPLLDRGQQVNHRPLIVQDNC